MPDSDSLLSRYGRWALYAVPICVMLLSSFGLWSAIHCEMTGKAKPGRGHFNQNIVFKEHEPEKFRELTNQRWAAGGWTFAIGAIGFLFAQRIDRYISNED